VLFFLRIIVYNFVTIYGYATKFGIRMRLYPKFQCTEFQYTRELDNVFVFYNNFHTLTKKEGKTKKLSQFSKAQTLETPGVI